MSAIYCAVFLTVPEQYRVTAQFENGWKATIHAIYTIGYLGAVNLLCRPPGIVCKSLICK